MILQEFYSTHSVLLYWIGFILLFGVCLYEAHTSRHPIKEWDVGTWCAILLLCAINHVVWAALIVLFVIVALFSFQLWVRRLISSKF